MSGKSKQQRTKGNVKPASSARTAELLASQSTSVSGIGGLGSTTLFGYTPPGAILSDQTDEVDTEINPEMRLIFKKLSKRDAATKLKALQELKQLCQSLGSDDVIKALPYWPRLFNRLAIDVNRRVREVTHYAHEQICVKAGRQLAAHLRVIVPCWLCTMSDPHSSAAKAAQTAFAATLPSDAKRADALVFCKDAIFNYITENLFEHTPSSLSDPKSTSPEEMQSKYERVVATSLLAVGYLLQQLLSGQKTAFIGQLDALFGQPRLWKYGKSKVPSVRLAVYKMIVTACQHIPETVTAHAGSICPVALAAIGETDRMVCSAAWEAALHALTKIEGCWSCVNIHKAVLPKMWFVLKDGGAGSADLIYPNLLPLIDLLPEPVVADGGFYLQFFSNMKKGLESSAVEQSSVACGALISSFFECLRYALSHGKIQQADTSYNVEKSLLCDHLLGILQRSLFEMANTNLCLPQSLYPSFASLVGYLVRNQHLPSEFWTDLGLMAIRAVNELRLDDTQKIDRNKSFLKELAVLCDGVEPRSSTDATVLHQIVQEAFKTCQCLAFEQESTSHLSLLACIFQSSTNPALLLHTPEDTDNQNAISDFVDSHLVPYLKQSSLNSSGFDTGLEILFALLSHSDEDHTCQTLNTLIKAKDGIPVILSVSNMLKSSSVLPVFVGAIRSWLRDDPVKNCVVSAAERLIHVREGPEQIDQVEEVKSMIDKMWMLVELAIASPEPLLTSDCTLQVLTLFGQFLDGLVNSDRVEDTVCRTTSKIMHLLQVRFEMMSRCLEDYDFHLACKVFHLLGYNWSSADSVWKAAVRAVQWLGREEEMLKTLCIWVKDKVLCCDSTDLAMSLAYQACQLFQPLAETSTISAALRDLLPTVQRWVEWRETYQQTVIAYRPFICGAVNISLLHRSDVLIMKQENRGPLQDHRHVCWSMFIAKLVLGDSNEKDGLHPVSPIELSLMPLEDVKNLSLELLWQLQVILNGGDSHDKAIEMLINLLQSGSRKLLQHIAHKQQIDDLFYLARHRSDEIGGIWAQVLGSLFTFCLSEETAFDSAMHTSFMCSKHKLSACELHSLQMLAISLEESSSYETIHPAVTSTAEALSQQLLTSPVATSLFGSSATTHLDACLNGLSLVNCSLRLGSKFESVECRPVTSQIIDQLIVWRDNSDAFLFDSSVVCASSVQLGFNTETCRFLSWAVRHFPSVMIDQHWEFVLCGLISWLQTCSEGFGDAQLVQTLGYQALAYQVFLLLATVSECFQSSLDEIIPPKITSDWQEYFSETSYAVALPMFLSMAERPRDEDSPYSNHLVMCAMSQAIIQCPAQCLKGVLVKSSKGVAAAGVLGDVYTSGLSENMTKYSSLLMNKSICVQAGSYQCLKKLIPFMVKLDTIELQGKDGSNHSTDQAEPDPASISLPESLLAVSNDASVIVTDLLRLVEGEQSSIPEQLSHVELESGCIAYCLCWLLILDCFKKANHQLRVHYSQSIKDNGRLRNLMRVLFSVMPDGKKSSQSALQGDGKLSSWDRPPSTGHANFWHWAQPEANKAADLVERLSCNVYFRCLQQLPALVRQWYSSTDKKTSLAVETFTSQFISPLLAQQELAATQECNYKSDNMQIRVRHSTREVVATYTIGEVSIELIVALSSSHPLSPVKVECGRRVGVPQAQWRNWMLQLTTFLSHQNGTILDGLVLWKDNLDKKFSGLDDCMICFSVIHGSNCSIPTLQCKTCKKRFHSACLYKWFSTSNVSSCPLCRNLF